MVVTDSVWSTTQATPNASAYHPSKDIVANTAARAPMTPPSVQARASATTTKKKKSLSVNAKPVTLGRSAQFRVPRIRKDVFVQKTVCAHLTQSATRPNACAKLAS